MTRSQVNDGMRNRPSLGIREITFLPSVLHARTAGDFHHPANTFLIFSFFPPRVAA